MSSSAIRVLHIARRMSGGIRVHITQLCNELDSDVYQQYLVTNAEGSDRGFKAALLERISVEQLRIERGPRLRDIFNLLKIYLFARRLNLAIIHGHGSKGGLYARIVGFFLGTKVIYTPHGGVVHDQGFAGGMWIQILIEKALFLITDAFVFESKFSRQQFSKRVRESSHRFYTNHNGIRIKSKNQPKRPERVGGKFLISAYGRLERAKGYDLLISAVHILATCYRLRLACHIFGEGESLDTFQKQINGLAAEEYISLKGFTSNVEKSMTAYDVVVQPSRHESFGYVALEAMVTGTPLIVTDVGGLREIVTTENDGLIAEPNSEDIAEKLFRVYSDPLLRRMLTHNAYLTVNRRFSLDRMITRIDAIYQSLLLNHRKHL
jgi:glycosyltransferase involved in cell wall biosynthesis